MVLQPYDRCDVWIRDDRCWVREGRTLREITQGELRTLLLSERPISIAGWSCDETKEPLKL